MLQQLTQALIQTKVDDLKRLSGRPRSRPVYSVRGSLRHLDGLEDVLRAGRDPPDPGSLTSGVAARA